MTSRHKFPWLEPFEKDPTAIWLRDGDGILCWANESFASGLKRPLRGLIGMKVVDLFAPFEATVSAEAASRVIRDRQPHEMIRSVMLQGSNRWFEVHHAPVPPTRTAGHGWCVLAHAIDVTARVQMSALRLLVGMREREPRKHNGDERFVRLLLEGANVTDICAALQLSVDEVTGRLSALAGAPLA